jgi:FKBP-type peptidyl-prolyl cis-trans isomerase FkpA
MKKILLAALVAALLLSCQSKTAKAPDAAAATPATPAKQSKADIGYAFGVLIGADLKTTAVDIDLAAFQKGLKDAYVADKTKVTPEAASETVQAAIAESRTKKIASNLAVEQKFLETNKAKKGIVTTASGLQYEVIKEGAGAKPKVTDTVKVDYVGTLTSGKEFDSSIKRKEPAVFPLEGVIPGWTEGIQLMSVGSKYKFFIPSALAYGDRGAGAVIEPNSTLVFEVDLLSIEVPEKPAAAPAPASKK